METCSVDYHHNCLVMTSGDFRIAVTTAVGPRIIGGWIGGKLYGRVPTKLLKWLFAAFLFYAGVKYLL